jgi:hypothetical protein
METHVRILGFLNLAWGLMGMVAMVVILVLFLGGFALLGSTTHGGPPFWLAGGIGTLFALVIIVSCLPSMLAGYGLLKQKQWGRVLALVIGVLELAAFPFGTALGAYSLYVLLHRDCDHIFGPTHQRPAVHTVEL